MAEAAVRSSLARLYRVFRPYWLAQVESAAPRESEVSQAAAFQGSLRDMPSDTLAQRMRNFNPYHSTFDLRAILPLVLQLIASERSALSDASWIESIGSDLRYAGFWGWPEVEQEAVVNYFWAWWRWLSRKPPRWWPLPVRTSCNAALRSFTSMGLDATIFLNLWRSALDEQRLDTLTAFVLSHRDLLRTGGARIVRPPDLFPDEARYDHSVRDWLLDPRTLDALRSAGRDKGYLPVETAQRLKGAIDLLAAAVTGD